jgi:hypothetical protein
MRHTTTRAIAATGGLLLTAVLAATPAAAYIHPGPPVLTTPRAVGPVIDNCLLERVGTQFVRCDDLTGNAVAAPAHIAERR